MLKITAVTLYKHGLGYFERSGQTDKDFALTFPRRAMDDVLKSLTVLPAGDTRVLGVAFETPDDRNADAQPKPVQLIDQSVVSGMAIAFSGYAVRVHLAGRSVDGTLIGIEKEDEAHLKRAVLAVSTASGIELVPLQAVQRLELTDPRAQADLKFALEQRQRDAERASARVALSAPSEVSVSYIAPAPAWRVSYRVFISPAASGDDDASRDVFVQGWGLFDNTLEDDLDGVQLTLTAGMPVSFRYELHQPNTPERPVVRDEERTVGAPLQYEVHDGAGGNDFMMQEAVAVSAAPRRAMMARKMAADVERSAPTQATGEARGALFAYTIDAPVSVRRGESGMVPIVAVKTKGARELIYNKHKNDSHPAASVRLKNDAITLERGPAVVLDGGHYGGEAVVPFTLGGSEIVLAFAMELGVTVRTRSSNHEKTVKLSFKDRSIFMDVVAYTTTTYEAVSTLAAACTLIIEHARTHDHTFDTAPTEQTLETGRFKLAVPARGKAHLDVVEKRTLRRYQDVTGLTGQAIKTYLADKLLEPQTVKALEGILAQEAEIAAKTAERQAIEAERTSIRMRMDDARKSIGPLNADTDTKLRARFVTQLSAHEDAMEALDARDRTVLGDLDRLRDAITAAALALGPRAAGEPKAR